MMKMFSYIFSKYLSKKLDDPRPLSDIIMRYRETWICGANGSSGTTINGRHYPARLRYTENSWGIAVWCAGEKRERLNVEGEEDRGDSLESFLEALARTLRVYWSARYADAQLSTFGGGR